MQWGVRYMRMEEDRREYDRIKCSFPVSFAGDHLNGSGFIVEISINGCALQASTELAEGNIIRMALQISDEAPPVQIEAAVVRAVRKSHIGIEFLRFQYDDRDRLQSFIRGLLLKQKS
jgi:hypothetical protein